MVFEKINKGPKSIGGVSTYVALISVFINTLEIWSCVRQQLSNLALPHNMASGILLHDKWM